MSAHLDLHSSKINCQTWLMQNVYQDATCLQQISKVITRWSPYKAMSVHNLATHPRAIIL